MLQEVKIAASQEEYCRIYILRYQVYIEEMGFKYPVINDQKRMLFDHLDESAIQFYVEDTSNQDIIGVCRLNRLNPKYVDSQIEERYHISLFSELSHSLGFVSKLMMQKNNRSICTVNNLFRNLFQYGIKNNFFINFIDCSPSLIPFYERLGFRRYAENFTDSILGLKTPMVLFVEDIEHLKKVKSPFYKMACNLKLKNKDYSSWLEYIFQLNEAAHA